MKGISCEKPPLRLEPQRSKSVTTLDSNSHCICVTHGERSSRSQAALIIRRNKLVLRRGRQSVPSLRTRTRAQCASCCVFSFLSGPSTSANFHSEVNSSVDYLFPRAHHRTGTCTATDMLELNREMSSTRTCPCRQNGGSHPNWGVNWYLSQKEGVLWPWVSYYSNRDCELRSVKEVLRPLTKSWKALNNNS